MKILHCFHYHNLRNGVDINSLNMLKALQARGIKPHAVVPKNGEVTQALTFAGIAYTVIPLDCCESHAWLATVKLLGQLHYRAEQICKLAAQLNVDLMHANTGHQLDVAIAATLCKVPLLWHIHSPVRDDFQRWQTMMSAQDYQHILQALSSQLLVVSQDIKQSFTLTETQQHCTVLYNGVNFTELESQASEGKDIRQELGLTSDSKLVLGIGRICQQKRFDLFARIAAQCKSEKIHFLIAGNAEEQQAVQQLHQVIQQHHLSKTVHLLGHRTDIPSLIKQSNVLLSTAESEGQGIAAIEALALKTPVVAMECEGLREVIVEQVSGRSFAPFDLTQGAATLMQTLKQPDAKLVQSGYAFARQHFNLEDTVTRYLELCANATHQFQPYPYAGPLAKLTLAALSQYSECARRLASPANSHWQKVKSRLFS